MLKLFRYLKPYVTGLIVAALLLFGQAMCDLNLPTLMSDIVNVGIQQGGIEDAVPQAVSQNGYHLMQVFMTDSQKQLLDENYRLVSPGNGEQYDKYVKKYPAMENQDVYILQKVNGNTKEQLQNAFGSATWTMINSAKNMSSENGEQQEQQAQNISDVDFAKIYEMLPTLQQMPSSQFDEARSQAEQVQQTMQQQTGAVLVKNFYTELGANTDNMQIFYIIKTGGFMLLIALAGVFAAIAVGYLSARIAAGVARNMRKDVFRKVESFSNGEFDKFSTASLITRSTNDITQIQMLIVMGIRMICYAPIMGIGGVILALRRSISMSWVIALVCIILIGLVISIYSIARPKFKIVQKLIDKLNLVSRENLSGSLVIRAFGTQEFETDRFEKANSDLTKTNLFVNRVMTFMMPAMNMVMNCGMLLIVWVGAHQIADSLMQVGDMMAFMQYAMQIIMSFLMLSMMFIMIPRAAVSCDRIQEVLETQPSILDPAQPKKFDESKKGWVEFNHVSFHYAGADEDVLHDITFTAKPGETTAFIGSTGSGKSTLINLIPRFYDVTDGNIKVSGVNIKDVSQRQLRQQIGYVPQKGMLLSGTIESNLRYGRPDASDKVVQEAIEVAQAEEFISQKENGIESEISEGGANVSGGQKQRLSIARALVKQAPIYIFDDSFSALDFKTDAALRKALKEKTGGSTVLIVAQRVSSIMHAEQIIVLDEGHIVGMGTHQQLLKSCPIYYEIASSQLSKEELQ